MLAAVLEKPSSALSLMGKRGKRFYDIMLGITLPAEAGMQESISSRTLAIAAVLILTLTAAGAKDNPDYTQIGHTITVAPGQKVGEVTCMGCSIHIRGQVTGDATTVGGNIFLEDQGQVGGEVTTVAGDVRLGSGVKIVGDLTVVGGEIRRAPAAQVGGDVTSVGGRAWAPMILLSPFVFLGLIVAFVVWLVRLIRGNSAAVETQPAHQRLVPNDFRTPTVM